MVKLANPDFKPRPLALINGLISRLDTVGGDVNDFVFSIEEVRLLESFSYQTLYDFIFFERIPIEWNGEGKCCMFK